MLGEKQEKLTGFQPHSVSEASELMREVTMHYSLSIALRISKSTKNKGPDFVQF